MHDFNINKYKNEKFLSSINKNMKKLFLSSLCFMVSLTTVAQTWNFGFGGGYLHNHFSMKHYKSTGNSGFKVEAVADYKLSSGFVFSSGLGFSQKGGTIEGYKIGGANDVRKVEAFPMNYLTVPLVAGYNVQLGKFSILPQIGVYAGIGVGGKGHVEGNDGWGKHYRERMNLFNAPQVTPYCQFNRYDYGATVAVNIDYSMFRLKAYYEHSLHEMNSLWGDPRHRSVGVSVLFMLK